MTVARNLFHGIATERRRADCLCCQGGSVPSVLPDKLTSICYPTWRRSSLQPCFLTENGRYEKARDSRNTVQIRHFAVKIIMQNKFILTVIRFCPVFSLIFSFFVVASTLTISEEISPIFVFLCAQVYANWFSIHRISRTTIVIASNSNLSAQGDSFAVQVQTDDSSTICRVPTIKPPINKNDKFWYCEKCIQYTSRPTRHCVHCKKCSHYRDHHCFLLGGCILRQNMGSFILICLYTSFASIYSLIIIGSYLYDHLDHFFGANSGAFQLILHFSFPFALARFLLYGQESCVVLVMLFDLLFAVSSICLIFGLWKFHACLTGRQRYYPHSIKKYNIIEIFGSYGLWNFLFPFNGFFRAKKLHETGIWKEM
ncbi:palmitoyltransferase app [Neodiprion lecontei]|uniref:Palmitoyltransferase n=1 Tax=Neodiprion lecontei TaxID=441921 RepID=A0A6J0CBC2_NEOLC|nr:palmitoyltransferase app [Neodiprion lecontei]XP_046470269.1 palmitoyltransferase app-like [Neodiprion pinetum]